ncbi:MAG TPA: DoxX family protein [Vicinamibacterales bacterium]|nr:DoxX family protein [Vicinamibacterales bacterium]
MSIFAVSRWAWADHALGLLRIASGVVFISVGSMKVFNYPPSPMPVALVSQMGIGGLLEVVGGLLIVLGLVTRPTAFILSGEMAVAYFQFHAPQSIFPTVNQGIPAILYCLLFFYLVFAGPGSWSLDAVIDRRRQAG